MSHVAALQSMLTHVVDVYDQEQTDAGGGDLVDGWSNTPDIDDLACYITMDGKTLAESPVGYIIESDAILYCEEAAIKELAKVVWVANGLTFTVNGTPNKYYHPLVAAPATPFLLEVGLRQLKRIPA
jgi:hypothetical protein